MDPKGAEFVHTVQECAKLAIADREAFYGDPNFVDVPLAELLSDDYNAKRRKLVGDDARLDLPPGHRGYGSDERIELETSAEEYNADVDARQKRQGRLQTSRRGCSRMNFSSNVRCWRRCALPRAARRSC